MGKEILASKNSNPINLKVLHLLLKTQLQSLMRSLRTKFYSSSSKNHAMPLTAKTKQKQIRQFQHFVLLYNIWVLIMQLKETLPLSLQSWTVLASLEQANDRYCLLYHSILEAASLLLEVICPSFRTTPVSAEPGTPICCNTLVSRIHLQPQLLLSLSQSPLKPAQTSTTAWGHWNGYAGKKLFSSIQDKNIMVKMDATNISKLK